MPTKLKALIFSLDNVALEHGKIGALSKEVAQLLRFVRSRGILPIVLANRGWTVTDSKSGKVYDAQEFYTPKWGEFPWYVANRGDCPSKPTAAAIEFVLKKHGLQPNEVVFLGNDDDDMRTAVNGRVLFLTASWFAPASPYGFSFPTPKDVARFIDVICLREHLWFYRLETASLRAYSLGLAQSKDPTAGDYSRDAIATFKAKVSKHREFWTQYLVGALYLSGMHDEIDIIAPYPGHDVGYGNSVVDDALITFAKCFRKTYCPDLIVRHSAAEKSQFARAQGKQLDHRAQLNSICLTSKPRRFGAQAYKNTPFSKKKSVLVVDDFTTEGLGLDSARAYLRAIKNVETILLVSFLRFPGKGFHELTPVPIIKNPFSPNTFPSALKTVIHPYTSGIVAPGSTKEIAEHYSAYDDWDWPDGV